MKSLPATLIQLLKIAKILFKIIIKELGHIPEYDLNEDDQLREIQLELKNRFTEQVAKEELREDQLPLLTQARMVYVDLLRLLPLQGHISNIEELLEFSKDYSESKKEEKVKTLLSKIYSTMDLLQKENGGDRKAIGLLIMEELSKYVANQANIANQRRNIIKRLRLGLENLMKHQAFMNEQMDSFNQYLQSAREKQVANKSDKKSKKKDKSVKFSYNKLAKQGVIIDSNVPKKSRGATQFAISKGEGVNEFLVKAKIAGITADTISLNLDDLLDKQSQSIVELKLDNVTLNVNMTIHMINKTFLQKA